MLAPINVSGSTAKKLKGLKKKPTRRTVGTSRTPVKTEGKPTSGRRTPPLPQKGTTRTTEGRPTSGFQLPLTQGQPTRGYKKAARKSARNLEKLAKQSARRQVKQSNRAEKKAARKAQRQTRKRY